MLPARVAAHVPRTSRHVLLMSTHAGPGRGSRLENGAARRPSIVIRNYFYSHTQLLDRSHAIPVRAYATRAGDHASRLFKHVPTEPPHASGRDPHSASGDRHVQHATPPHIADSDVRAGSIRTRCKVPPGTRHAPTPTPFVQHYTPTARAPTRRATAHHALQVPSHAVRHRHHGRRAAGHALPIQGLAPRVGMHEGCRRYHGEAEPRHRAGRAHHSAVSAHARSSNGLAALLTLRASSKPQSH